MLFDGRHRTKGGNQMDDKAMYDVIIVGGGPAGLAVGSELSRDHAVLLIDKNVVGQTHKSWFVPLDVIDEKVKPFTYGGVTRFMAHTFGGASISWKAELFDRYPYVNEKTLLPHWLEIMKRNGATLLENCTYLDCAVQQGVVTVTTSAGEFRTRLLIDASGYDSPIIQRYNIDRNNDYWWSVYGSIGEHPNGLNGMAVGDYMMWQTFSDTDADASASMEQGRPVFEYEILDEGTSFSFIFYLRKERMPREVMEKMYTAVIRNEPSTVNFHDLKIKEVKYGWYPSGALSQQIAEDHVVFIGDAGCWTTPCGWGMTFILRNYQYFANQIRSLLSANTLDKKALLSVPHYKVHEKWEVLLDTIVTHFLSNATAPELDRFIDLFNKIPKILCEKIFTLTVTREDLHVMLKAILKEFTPLELAHLLPARDYLLVMDEASFFAESAMLNAMSKFVHSGTKASTSSVLDEGFNFS